MKNFITNKITQLVLILVLSLGLLVGLVLGTNGIASKNEGKRLLKQLETFFPDVTEYEEIENVGRIEKLVNGYKLFTDGEEIGLVLEAKTTNQFSDKGFIHLMVGVANDKTITGIKVIEMDQSLRVADTLKNVNLYVGSVVGDLITSANNNQVITGATYSLDSINELMVAFKNAFEEFTTAITAPFTEIFGTEYILVEDSDFEKTEHVVSKGDVRVDGEHIGYIFTLQNSGIYYGSNEGAIEMIVAVLDDKIMDYEFTVYKHTLGFQPNVLGFIDRWIGTDLVSYPTLDEEDLETGSTNTTTMVDEMFRELRDEYIKILAGPFANIFGSEYEVVLDDSFTATDHVISKGDVKVDEVLEGYVFTLRNSGVYHRDSEGTIEMLVAVKDGKIVGYKFTIYEHTPGFRQNVLGFIEDWIGTDLSDYPNIDDVDLKTGSTNTTTMVDEMFRELRDEFVKLGGGE